MHVSSLNFYPLKSGPVISLQTAIFTNGGIIGDRQFMLIDKDTGKFVSLRDRFSDNLTQLTMEQTSDGFRVTYNGNTMIVGFTGAEPTETISYRNIMMSAHNMGREVAEAFSDILGHNVTLFRAAKGSAFPVDGNPDESRKNNAFSDGYPVLITNQASLIALQKHFAIETNVEIGMARFRPNIVIDGAKPFAEDTWKIIEIDGVRFYLEKPCQRCVITTKDPETGGKESDAEPIKTLINLRRGLKPNTDGTPKPMAVFGMNAVPLIPGIGQSVIQQGATMTVVETYDPVHPFMAKVKLGPQCS